ncbi:MAG: hypothetical protein KC777_15645 [Cyanobacteria bacterium HKST-UBA02]|nr:hypothetical protein [Cyanobacteria bacterium HKST-UBA02]
MGKKGCVSRFFLASCFALSSLPLAGSLPCQAGEGVDSLLIAAKKKESQPPSVFEPFLQEVEALFQEFYPKAKVKKDGNKIQVSYKCHEYADGSSGRHIIAPQLDGILLDMEAVPGKYKGKEMLPHRVNETLYVLLLMAPYSAPSDHHMHTRLLFPHNTPESFVRKFQGLVEDFDRKVKAEMKEAKAKEEEKVAEEPGSGDEAKSEDSGSDETAQAAPGASEDSSPGEDAAGDAEAGKESSGDEADESADKSDSAKSAEKTSDDSAEHASDSKKTATDADKSADKESDKSADKESDKETDKEADKEADTEADKEADKEAKSESKIDFGGARLSTYTFSDGRFQIRLPGKPDAAAKELQGMRFSQYKYREPQGSYNIGYTVLPTAVKVSSQGKMVIDLTRSLAAVTKGKSGPLTSLPWQGYPGCQVDVSEIPGDGFKNTRLRVFLVRRYLYIVQAIGTKAWLESPAVKQVLDSLVVRPELTSSERTLMETREASRLSHSRAASADARDRNARPSYNKAREKFQADWKYRKRLPSY